MSDPACGLVFRDAIDGDAEADGLLSPRTRQLLWLLVIGVHILLAALWQQASLFRAAAVDTVLEVVWISAPRTAELVIPPMPTVPERAAKARPAAAAAASPATERAQPVASDAVEVAPEAEAAASLFMPDGRLRIAQPEATAADWGDRERISRDRMPSLPGATDAAAAEVVAIRLRRAMTPEDVVLAVVQFVLGRPRPDDCRKIEGRLYLSDPGVGREIDLNKFRRACAGVSVRGAFDD